MVTPADFDALIERVRDARLVLLGEASHGTSDYYRWRAEITRLIAERGFSFVAVEGDWPDCFAVNRWVNGRAGHAVTLLERDPLPVHEFDVRAIQRGHVRGHFDIAVREVMLQGAVHDGMAVEHPVVRLWQAEVARIPGHGAQQQLENHILVPKIMEQQVGVSAVTVIAALLVGGSLLGILGAILAVPTAAIIQVVVQELLDERDRRADQQLGPRFD